MSTSRVIVKNLPRNMKEGKFKQMFSECGRVTDCKLKMSEKGTFRRFGFIGFATEAEALTAVEKFHNTFIKATKIQVELALPYGDRAIDRPWSKYSQGSSAFRQLHPATGAEGPKVPTASSKVKQLNAEVHKSKLVEQMDEFYKLECESGFQEFLAAHTQKSASKKWANDELEGNNLPSKRDQTVSLPAAKKSLAGESQSSTPKDAINDNQAQSQDVPSHDVPSQDVLSLSSISDLEYLRTKVVKDDTIVRDDPDMREDRELGVSPSSEFTVKMLGLPFNVKEKDIHNFFHPLTVLAVRQTKDQKGRPSGRAYADFETEYDLGEALKRNGDYIKRRYIQLFRDYGPGTAPTSKTVQSDPQSQLKPWELRVVKKSDEDEDLSETGRLFVRNLAYTTSEDDLSEHFSKYGPLTEVHVPLAKDTNKVIGYAFVTFMFPEHAVKAYQESDGTIFQGRLIHILPAKTREGPSEEDLSNEGSSYKKQKEKKMKKQASSSHNWNALFLGTDAVVDSMANRYEVDKRDILDARESDSLAVRIALGETQVVSDTKSFLEQHGVNLDIFGKPNVARSKNIILVKNLPFGTTDSDLNKLFSPFGSISRLVLPPGGVSALVEYSEIAHAQSAFRKLAYTKYRYTPLYLEWAPAGSLREVDTHAASTAEEEEPTEETSEDEKQVVAMATVFVKNLNFSTDDQSLKNFFTSSSKHVIGANVAYKKNFKEPAKPLSMGYGFVEFDSCDHAQEAVKKMQGAELEGHRLELKLSHRETVQKRKVAKSSKVTEQTTSKILIKNVPFEATKKELLEILKAFGEVKVLRLPRKISGSRGEHRGFAFVEYTTKKNAKKAFEALCSSTHLYGRRLVLEWAEEDATVEMLRKRTSDHYYGEKPPARRSRQLAQELLLSAQSSQNDTS